MENNIRKIIQVGKSVAVVIPTKMLKEKNLKQGDYIRLDKITKVEIQVNDVKEKQKKL